jgi:aspartate aminotransferase
MGQHMSAISARMIATDAAFEVVKNFFFNSRYADRRLEPGICDFTFGNPHEMPLEGIVTAIRERAIPHDKNWFAYKTSEQDPQAFIAERLSRELDLKFEPGDIALTAGAFAAIMVAFRLVWSMLATRLSIRNRRGSKTQECTNFFRHAGYG